jgi:hypothetical protein
MKPAMPSIAPTTIVAAPVPNENSTCEKIDFLYQNRKNPITNGMRGIWEYSSFRNVKANNCLSGA